MAPFTPDPDTLDACLVSTERFEGCVPWMYRDTTGNVTAGIGFLITGMLTALALPWEYMDGTRATPAQIAHEWMRVNSLPAGKPATFYRAPDALVLPHDEIVLRLENNHRVFYAQLAQRFPDLPDFPKPAQYALMDMAYNLGITKLTTLFRHFCAAVDRKDWQACADHCHRIGPGPERNAWTKAQFLEAAK